MRLNRVNRLLLMTALGIAGLTVWLERRRAAIDPASGMVRALPDLDVRNLRALRIETERFSARFERQHDRWWIKEPIEAPADDEAIERILVALERLPRRATLAPEEWRSDQQSLVDFGLDPPRLRLELTGRDRTQSLSIGRNAPLGDSVYGRIGGEPEILLLPKAPLSLLPERLDQFRDRALYRGDLTRARRLDVRRQDGWIRVQRGETNGWVTASPFAGRADAGFVQDLLRRLMTSRVGRFVEDTAEDGVKYGLDEPVAVLELEAPALEPADALLIGKPVPTETGWHYARYRRRDAVFTVSSALVDRLLAPFDDWRDRRLTALDPVQIAQIRLELDDRLLRIERTAAGWTIVEPSPGPAEPERVEALIRSWAGAPILRFIDPPAADELLKTFEPPLGRVLLYTASGVDPAALILISKQPPDEGRVRVRVSTESTVYEVPAPMLSLLSPDPLLYRDPRLFGFDAGSVYRIALVREGREQAVRRDRGGPFVSEDGTPVDDVQLRARLDRIVRMRVRYYAAERPPDLSRFGLDAPEAKLTLGLAEPDGIVKTLLVGPVLENGERFAMLAGRDLVFALDPETWTDLVSDLVPGGAGLPPASSPAQEP